MNIYFVDKNSEMCIAWEDKMYSSDFIYNETINDFLIENNKKIEAIVIPGNSEMNMDGGFDLGIFEVLDQNDIKLLKSKMKELYGSIIPVGNCVSIKGSKVIIYIPTMYYPMEVLDYSLIFGCTYTSLIEAKKYNVKSIVLPAFCAGTGKVPFNIVAQNMNAACELFLFNKKKVLDKIKYN